VAHRQAIQNICTPQIYLPKACSHTSLSWDPTFKQKQNKKWKLPNYEVSKKRTLYVKVKTLQTVLANVQTELLCKNEGVNHVMMSSLNGIVSLAWAGLQMVSLDR
jgi:hypothetical protein